MTRHIIDPNDCTAQRFLTSDESRDEPGGDLVEDAATDLVWPRNANPLGYPLPWQEALDAVARLNREQFLGHGDWRMPNRRELRSLICHGAKTPALPPGHPFTGVFSGWHWTSTTKAGHTAYAWNVHLEGGRMFYSRKDEFRLLWPVRGPLRDSLGGTGAVLPQTGQTACFDAEGRAIPCLGTGQDGELRAGVPWPAPRFTPAPHGVLDLLTGLCWLDPAHLPRTPLTWREALDLAAALPPDVGPGWRLPNINELESLVDAAHHDPALPPELAATTTEGLWSATTSGFDAAWAFVLYVQKGAVGVGFKANGEFQAWPVREL